MRKLTIAISSACLLLLLTACSKPSKTPPTTENNPHSETAATHPTPQQPTPSDTDPSTDVTTAVGTSVGTSDGTSEEPPVDTDREPTPETDSPSDGTNPTPPSTTPPPLEPDIPPETTPPETTAPGETEPETEPAPVKNLPMANGFYVLGDPENAAEGAAHYLDFQENHRLYHGDTFLLYGTCETIEGIPTLSFGMGMNLPLRWNDGLSIPSEGTYVKLTATYTLSPTADDTAPSAPSMTVTAVEILKEPPSEAVILHVLAVALTVRSEPDSAGPPVGTLYKGDTVRLLESACGEHGDYCRIAFESDQGSVCGYVKAIYLQS